MAHQDPHFAAHTDTRTGRRSGGMTQSWHVGEIVNVGFVRGLMVLKVEPTPGDFAPDAYLLRARSGAEYRFVPHNGLTRTN